MNRLLAFFSRYGLWACGYRPAESHQLINFQMNYITQDPQSLLLLIVSLSWYAHCNKRVSKYYLIIWIILTTCNGLFMDHLIFMVFTLTIDGILKYSRGIKFVQVKSDRWRRRWTLPRLLSFTLEDTQHTDLI